MIKFHIEQVTQGADAGHDRIIVTCPREVSGQIVDNLATWMKLLQHGGALVEGLKGLLAAKK
jgi:hypothetical protein